MRPLFLLPVLLLTLACSSKLERRKAEDLLQAAYPVAVRVTVPDQASAEKGSSEHLRLAALKENLDKTGWFDTTQHEKGGREVFTFRLNPGASREVKASPKGFQVPAAQIVFVRALRMEPTREGARVAYQVRLDKPTAQFSIFQALHPGAHIGETKERHATFERRKGGWEIVQTDEAFKKAE